MLLEVEHVSHQFGGLWALRDVSLQVPEGALVAIIGPNGAGKTTLFNCIAGALRPTRGQIRFAGRRIDGLPPYKIARLGLTRTFQLTRPFHSLSVYENVLVGTLARFHSKSRAEAKAKEILQFVGLADRAQRLASQLTTADRKRLELARALATQPKLLLLDEVMSGLTPTETGSLERLVRTIRDTGVTIVLIEHVMRVVMGLAEQAFVLHHGQLIAAGPPQEIVRNRTVLEAYLGEELHLADGRAD